MAGASPQPLIAIRLDHVQRGGGRVPDTAGAAVAGGPGPSHSEEAGGCLAAHGRLLRGHPGPPAGQPAAGQPLRYRPRGPDLQRVWVSSRQGAAIVHK